MDDFCGAIDMKILETRNDDMATDPQHRGCADYPDDVENYRHALDQCRAERGLAVAATEHRQANVIHLDQQTHRSIHTDRNEHGDDDKGAEPHPKSLIQQ